METAARQRRTPRGVISIVVVLGLAALALGACGGNSKDAEAVDASSTTASQGGSYSTQAFILPFDVMVPDLFPTEATTDTANFVTWETAIEGDPAVRGADPDLEAVVGDAESHLVVGARAGEDREGRGVGHLAGRGEAAGDRHHVCLGGPNVEEALGELLAELHRLGRDRQVGVERNDFRVTLAQRDEGIAIGLPGGDRLGLRLGRVDQLARHQDPPRSALVCCS